MALDPQIADIIERIERAGRPPFWKLSPEQARESYEKGAKILEIAATPLERIDDFSIRARDGYALALRYYVPRKLPLAAPAFVYYHGGGFTVGNLNTHDAICRMFAKNADCIVLSVDYRLAPEHRFPTAANDAWDALAWLRGNAYRLGIDANRIAVGGDSAGGTLAAVNAIQSRERGWPLALQLLIYPGAGQFHNTPSHQARGRGYLLDDETIRWFFDQYLSQPMDRLDWRFDLLGGNPAPVLEGLAPACVVLAGYDPLYDGGHAYAQRMSMAGVQVQILDYPGMIHGFFNFGRAVDAARQAHRDTVDALRRAFETH